MFPLSASAPGTPGEDRGGGLRRKSAENEWGGYEQGPLPNPPPEYRGREKARKTIMTETFTLDRDTKGRLILKRPGQEDLAEVRIRRAFPWSSPDSFISIRNAKGKEVMMIDNLADLPGPLKQTIDRYLAGTSFIPRIQRVIHVDVRFGFQTWTVETDRGQIEFRVQGREDIRFMPDGRFCVKDADGNLYELRPLWDLDEASRKAIEALV